MGKLYNRADMEAQTALIDATEQRAAQRPGFAALRSAGYEDVKQLRKVKQLEAGGKPLEPEDVIALEFLAINVANNAREFETERRKARMRLLQTGSLVRDFQYAERHGSVEAFKKMVRRISWATKENSLRRLQLEWLGYKPGNVLEDIEHELNEWERWYLSDLHEGIWPGQTPEIRASNALDYGAGYLGWLKMMKFEEEIPLDEYERQRTYVLSHGGQQQ